MQASCVLRACCNSLQRTVFGSASTASRVWLPAVKTNINRGRLVHTTRPVQGMEEFFDDPSNWGEKDIKVGRSWKQEELRLKSNEDLHKLWYVLLKEQNMLYAMEYAHEQEHILFPNAERIDKVKESMSRLEEVVRERNRAYWMLETGETGDRPGGKVHDELGFFEHRDFTESHVPAELNVLHQQYKYQQDDRLDELHREYKEQLKIDKERALRKVRRHVAKLFAKFPHIDVEMMKERYPELDIDAIRKGIVIRGHHDHEHKIS